MASAFDPFFIKEKFAVGITRHLVLSAGDASRVVDLGRYVTGMRKCGNDGGRGRGAEGLEIITRIIMNYKKSDTVLLLFLLKHNNSNDHIITRIIRKVMKIMDNQSVIVM